ncbi:MAG: hypothetical protein CMM77_13900 [Rhodospirillaceae bacterium]|nr:hypothetical protein [Rhodospirillaceae bacterium]|tara:strand:+ start:223 stop:615 length:393 start_codon:yes stop_codon:yes gene_type:complete
MSPIYSIALETTAMIVSLALILAGVLFMRFTQRSTWRTRDAIDSLLSIAIGVAILIAIGLEVDALIRAGLGSELATLAAPVVCAAVAKVIWHGFHCRERLTMAEAGLSPFGRLIDIPRQVPEPAQEANAQ